MFEVGSTVAGVVAAGAGSAGVGARSVSAPLHAANMTASKPAHRTIQPAGLACILSVQLFVNFPEPSLG